MSSQVAAQEHEVVGGPPPGGNYLFQEPIRVNPSAADPVTQQIQSKLGDFQRVRPFLSSTSDNGLIGVDGVPPSPGGPMPQQPLAPHHLQPHQTSSPVSSRHHVSHQVPTSSR
ncbi:unnamed protein product, partial [Callosobruchus maculatus]